MPAGGGGEVFCWKCGAAIESSAKFCTKCGSPATPPAATPAPPALPLAAVPQPAPPPAPPAAHTPQYPAGPAAPAASRTAKRFPIAIVAVVLIATLAVAGVGAYLLVGGGGGGSSLIQGTWTRSGMCGVTWQIVFGSFGSFTSTETNYDDRCNVLSAPTEGGSWTSEDAGDHVDAYFWENYKATVHRSTPNDILVSQYNSAGSPLYSWDFTRA